MERGLTYNAQTEQIRWEHFKSCSQTKPDAESEEGELSKSLASA